MRISRLSENDLEQLGQLYQQLIPNEFSVEKMKEALSQNNVHDNPIVLVAKEHGKVLGTLLAVSCQMLFGPCKTFLVVEDVVVDNSCRRQGIGTALMQHIEQYARSRNCSYIMLITDADRTNSQLFYRSLGYKTDEYRAFKKRL